MDADARGLARFGLLLAVACALTGAVAFAQLGAGLGNDEAIAAAETTLAPASTGEAVTPVDLTAPAPATR